MPTRLELFLNGNPSGVTEKDRDGRQVTEAGKPYTHINYGKGTKWYIDDDDLPRFLELYCSEVKHKSQYITERQSRIGHLRVDLDFKYEGVVEEHKHTQEQVINFVRAYMGEVRKFLVIPSDVEIYILEKDYPTPQKKEGAVFSKSGLHIQIPDIKTHTGIEKQIKRELIGRMESFFPDLGFKDKWDSVYDEQPLRHNGHWMLIGSQKPDDGSLPYETKYILDWHDGEISVDTDVPTLITPELVKKLSQRSLESEETPMTEEGKKYIRQPSESTTTRATSRGRGAERGDPGSRNSSPGRNYTAPLTTSRREYIRAHAMNLAEFRHSGSHDEYVKVGQTLKNIHDDLEDVWLDFMAQSSDEGRRRNAVEKWRGFGFRVEGERSGIGSLLHWSREDNYEQFQKIETMNVDRMVEEAASSGTEYDVAQVIFAKFYNEFKCANFRQNEWYHYVGHIWRSTDNGVELIRRLSTDIAKLFRDKEEIELHTIAQNGECTHSNKDKDPSCDTCRAEERKKKYSDIRLKLKRTGFKDSAMKECRVLFFDKDFAKKLDENKHLIAFNNGVFDTLTQTFRDGRPEDYISFCTEIDYAVDTQYNQFKCWTEVEKFLHSILPNKNVREYFLKHLATCLSGVFNQRFHILTGSGSNGKSMLMNLCSTAFGEYCYKANIAMFTQKRNKAGAASPEMVRMKGKRFVMMSEPDEGDPLSTGFMKEITSSEKIIARDLFAGSKQMVEFDVQAKCHLACNDKPKVNTTDGGTWRRLKVIDFPSKFVHTPRAPNELPMDETIESKVLSKEWAECFMAYLTHMYTEGKGLHKLTPPKEVDAYTNEYKEDSDAIAKFMTEYFHAPEAPRGDEPGEGVHWTTIQAAFSQWKREIGESRGATTDLRKRVETQYGALPKGSHDGWMNFSFGPR
jgi:P4 family phage/plasmid primase-like protien